MKQIPYKIVEHLIPHPQTKVTDVHERKVSAIEFAVREEEQYFMISGVPLIDGYYDCRLGKQLLADGKPMLQSEWSEYTRKQRPLGQFHAASAETYHALFTALYQQRDHLEFLKVLRKLQHCLYEKFQSGLLGTLSTATYRARTDTLADIVTHDCGLSTEHVLWYPHRSMTDQSGFITRKSSSRDVLGVILGDTDSSKINAIYRWITNDTLDSYVWTLDEIVYTENLEPVEDSLLGRGKLERKFPVKIGLDGLLGDCFNFVADYGNEVHGERPRCSLAIQLTKLVLGGVHP